MAEDDTDRSDEYVAEREAEIEDELERIDRDPEEVDEGSDLGKQSAPRRADEERQADDES
ncbi:hypothetical protein [Natronosalvus caseinilyticus]|uniref:hypothetical protein n=1 Tax=Natronosalvus caseinilyticus TaxID=2953747 RepID=UPI0028ACFAE7|nr:hypothetical protein [Natronosalvus caseinilyticus]